LQSNAKIVAVLQLPASELIFSAIWVVLILALKINVLREMTFNFTLVGTTTWKFPELYTSLHIFNQPRIEIAWTPAWVVGEVQNCCQQQCLFATRPYSHTSGPTRMWVGFLEKDSSRSAWIW